MLLLIDVELAAKVRAGGCVCGGRLHQGNYARKPRGGPDGLDEKFELRFSFCCGVEGCRARRMPPSVRFLGPKVFYGALVVLASAMLQGPTKQNATLLGELLGISRRTLGRWRGWWLISFPASRFWRSLRGRFIPVVEEETLPLSLVERLGGDESSLLALLRLLQPISTTPGLEASAS